MAALQTEIIAKGTGANLVDLLQAAQGPAAHRATHRALAGFHQFEIKTASYALRKELEL